MKKSEVEEFTLEVISQVIKGVNNANKKIHHIAYYPEYIDFNMEIEDANVSFRILTK